MLNKNSQHASSPLKIRCRQIRERDIAAVENLLKQGYPQRSLSYWKNATRILCTRDSPSDFPRFGYVLDSEQSLAGVLLTLFAKLPGGSVRCNISSWYVVPQFRGYGPLLSAQAQKHKEVTYLNTSPAPHTLPIIKAQGFRELTAGVFIGAGILNGQSHRAKLYSFPDQVSQDQIPSPERSLLLDHHSYGCHCIWCEDEHGGRPYIFRRRYVMRRTFPCAHLIYCPSLEDLSRRAGLLSRFLLVRGMPLMTVNANGPLPEFAGRYFHGFRPMYARGADVRAGDIAYSEGAMFGM